MENVIYIRMRHRVQLRKNHRVKVKDIARVVGPDRVVEQVEEMDIYQITDGDQNIVIIDFIQLLHIILQKLPQLELQGIGPTQTIIEVIHEKKKMNVPFFIIVWLLLFVGAALAVMNFHEDVSMQSVHQKLYTIITGKTEEKPLLFQIPYSFGLGIGMILFFNHFFRKRFNEEPSPLEVEMFNYQQDLDRYVVMNENKESVKQLDDR
ncbi:stage V sporulation protein AA [Peribacillus alkalitolerans]|uniref:stage V sporulation protein AA n=1 Tax=Peribacillus alkalitolerans TaxID=1550385 RepID=UPI0013D127E1|nr:stage V sporulation protein AA [Peribacillus alkalitolerans]